MEGLTQIQFIGETQMGWTLIGLDGHGQVWRGVVVGHSGPEPEIRWMRIKEQRV